MPARRDMLWRTCGLAIGLLLGGINPLAGAEFTSRWPLDTNRVWLGPDYWANPLQDWRLSAGRLECHYAATDRHVHLLTRCLGMQSGDVRMSVRTGLLGDGSWQDARGAVGFRLGIQGTLPDYRSGLLYGKGLDTCLTTDGQLYIGALDSADQGKVDLSVATVELQVTVQPAGNDYSVQLAARDPASGRSLGTIARTIPGDQLVGGIALVVNPPLDAAPPKPRRTAPPAASARFWFRDWTLSGSKLEAHDDRAFGPILFAMHTLSRGVMKMTAQMPPIADTDTQLVRLQIRNHDQWSEIARAPIDRLSRTANFRVENWNDQQDVAYRLAYAGKGPAGEVNEHYYEGIVRHDPRDKDTIVVAGFTGHQDYLFPNSLLAGNVEKLDPDILVFTGDQIYENNAGYGIVRSPTDIAALDYLRKWYVFGWGFRDVMRSRVTLCLPDDHDVYQGNIWGEGGKNCGGMENHDAGGYAMPAEWVNAVQRMQSSHHPDPYDAAPIEQGITVYYGPLTYGRISVAVIEDRKFKSGPAGKVNSWAGRPDHLKDPALDPKTLDKPGLELLGERQLAFLRDWAADWRGADMKLVVSQTIFANVANYHGGEQMYLVADLDSNGWPQSGRKAALDAMRRGFALHLAGDQHLASIVHHGIDQWRDAGWSFCVPSIAAGYPRSWHPEREGKIGQNREPGMAENLGDFRDGLGNLITVHAIGNPETQQRSDPQGRGHDKASGFGIVRLNKKTQQITLECWRLLVDTAHPRPGDQFPGWPMTISMAENYGQPAAGYLPTIKITGLADPVLQVIEATTSEVIYTLRIKGSEYRPKVFRGGEYLIRVGDPDTDRWRTLRKLRPSMTQTQQRVVSF